MTLRSVLIEFLSKSWASKNVYEYRVPPNHAYTIIVYNIPYRRVHTWPGGCIGRVRA